MLESTGRTPLSTTEFFMNVILHPKSPLPQPHTFHQPLPLTTLQFMKKDGGMPYIAILWLYILKLTEHIYKGFFFSSKFD
jgi:hypothetical protein